EPGVYTVKGLQKKGIIIRIITILFPGIIIWKLIFYMSNMFMGPEYNPLNHFITALITTISTITLIKVILKIDKTSWNKLEPTTVKSSFFSFLQGFFLWTIPASIGLFVCLMLGWVDIQ